MKRDDLLAFIGVTVWFGTIFMFANYIFWLDSDYVPYQFDSIQTLPGILMGGAMMGMIFAALKNPDSSFRDVCLWMMYGSLFNWFMLWPWEAENAKMVEQSMFFIYVSIFFFFAYKTFKTGHHTPITSITLSSAWFYNVVAFPLHILMLFPMLVEFHDVRANDVQVVVESRDRNHIFCQDPELHCFVYTGPESIPMEIDEDAMTPIRSFAELPPNVNYSNQWEIIKKLKYNYRIYGAFFDDDLKFNLVISTERHHNEWRDLGNDFVYYFHPVFVGAFMWFLMVIWFIYVWKIQDRVVWLPAPTKAELSEEEKAAKKALSAKRNKLWATIFLISMIGMFAAFMYYTHFVAE